MKREDGFYWVKSAGKWEVAQWFAEQAHWWCIMDEDRYTDTAFEEIDERRIDRET